MAGFTFQKASRRRRKARIGLIGPSGSGKTYTALLIAQGLVGHDGRIALIDTENSSSELYADEFEFDVLNLNTFSPQVYVDAIHAAEQAGYDVLIIDSLSHAWAGAEGALEQVDKAMARYKGNRFAAWRYVTPEHNRLVDALVRCKAHVIATMRAKTAYEVQKDEDGKATPVKIGLAPIQRDGLEYEFDIVADMDLANRFIVSKTRMRSLTGAVIEKPGRELGESIGAWLNEGEAAPETDRNGAARAMQPPAQAAATQPRRPAPKQQQTPPAGNGRTSPGTGGDETQAALSAYFAAIGDRLSSEEAKALLRYAWAEAAKNTSHTLVDSCRDVPAWFTRQMATAVRSLDHDTLCDRLNDLFLAHEVRQGSSDSSADLSRAPATPAAGADGQ